MSWTALAVYSMVGGGMNWMLSLWQFSSDTWKLISSVFTWILLLLHKKTPLLSLTSPYLASFCSEQCLKCCITSTSCDCLPLYNVSFIVFLNCNSLWIKVSAKWINVNVWFWVTTKNLILINSGFGLNWLCRMFLFTKSNWLFRVIHSGIRLQWSGCMSYFTFVFLRKIKFHI